MSKELTIFEVFSAELTTREDEIASILPAHIPAEKFRNTALIAAKNNTDLLTKANRRSLHQAITEAAEDGLQPDGREGAIVLYGNEAQWSPMMYGLRKRAMELSQMVIDAQVVHANDHFVWHQGDEARIEHVPAQLGQSRGDMIGAYAIFKANGVILHREVMSKQEIEMTRNQSRTWAKSLMWTKFTGEAWRKTVVRRGIKTVPSVPALERLISREDRNFDFSGGFAAGTSRASADAIPSAPKASKQIETTAEEIADEGVIEGVAEEVAPEPPKTAGKGPKSASKAKGDQSGGSIKDAFLKALEAAQTPVALNGVWDIFGKKFPEADVPWATDEFEKRYNQMSGG